MVIPFILVVCLQGVPPPPAGPTPLQPKRVAQLIDILKQALPEGRRFECHLKESEWAWSLTKGPFDPTKEPSHDVHNFTVRSFGDGQITVTNEVLQQVRVELNGYHYDVWTKTPSATVIRGSHDTTGLGLALALQVNEFDPFDYDMNAIESVQKSIPVSSKIDGSVITFRFIAQSEKGAGKSALARDPNSTESQHEILVDIADPPRVLGWSKEGRTEGGRKSILRWTVESWQTLDGKPFPQRVRREIPCPPHPSQKQPDTKKPFPDVLVQLVEITDLVPMAADVATPRLIAEGTRVKDRDLHLEFVVGSPDIVFNGRALRLKEPMWEHPGKKLNELVKGAVER